MDPSRSPENKRGAPASILTCLCGLGKSPHHSGLLVSKLQNKGAANFFYNRPDGKCVWLFGPYSLCCIDLALPLWRQQVSE